MSEAVQFRVWLFGAFQIESAEGAVSLPSSRARSLLAYLLLSPGVPHVREVVADQLWPEDPPDRVLRNFSDALYRLRQALGSTWFVVKGDTVALMRQPGLWVDVWTFKDLSAASDPPALQRAVRLYRGDLLPEVYDDWLLVRRVALRERYLGCLLNLARIAEGQGKAQMALEHYRRLGEADPLREEAHRGAMRCLARLGRYAAALDAYTRLETLLAQELQVPPSAESHALAETLRREWDLARSAEDGPAPAPRQIPFVGRLAERSRLLELLNEAGSGQGRCVVLLGEAGIGKTRLLEDLVEAASWRGWQVVWGRGEEFALHAPYAPLDQALAAALPPARLQQVRQLLPTSLLAALMRAIPTLQRGTGIPEKPSWTPEPGLLPYALRRLLHALQQVAPHLILLDDIQWADPGLWSLLGGVCPALREMALLIVVSGRVHELQAQPHAWSALEAWDRAQVPLIHLEGLTLEEMRTLVASQDPGEISAAQLAELARVSGGNPLFVLTSLQDVDLGSLGDAASPEEIVLRRISQLPREAHLALQAAAVIGYRFPYLLWETVLAGEGLPADRIPSLAGELEQAGLIQLEAETYRFAHDTLRATVYRHTPEATRQRLHQHVLALRVHSPDADPLTLLRHAEGAGRPADVARYALLAGEQALDSFAFQGAADLFSKALQTLAPDEVADRYRAVLGRLRALEVLADRPAQQADLSTLQDLADRLDGEQARVEVAFRRARFHWMTGELDQALAEAEAGLAHSPEEDLETQADLLELLGLIERERNHYDPARTWIVQARALHRRRGNVSGEASTTHVLGSLAVLTGDYPAAVDHLAAAVDLFREMGNTPQEIVVLNMLGRAFLGLGDYAQARATHEHALAVARELGDRRGQLVNTGNLARIAVDLGDYAVAIERYTEVLDLCRETGDGVGLAITLGNLGEAYRQLGQFDVALDYFEEALRANRDVGRRRGEGYALQCRGLALLSTGDLEPARQALEEALAIRLELGEVDNLLENHAALALALAAEDRPEEALASVEAALGLLDPERDRGYLQQWVHFVAHRVLEQQGQAEAATGHLLQAQEAMHQAANALPEEDRARFLAQVPLNREVQAALDARTRRVQVRLVRADVPLGRKLTEADYVPVTWTLHSPEDDRIGKKADRRQAVLRRLLAEAAAQGAAPTDDDLASALGVSRRTILRDMAVLSQAGVKPLTRKRARQE